MSEQKPFVVCITGPTATGKTAAAVAVCRALTGEVLSMDSMQIYQQLEIGTARPSIAEQDGIVHHLLSYVSPQTPYTVAEYQKDAREVMADVLRRGSLPVFAGGTGLYLQAVSRPLGFTEAGFDPSIREELERMAGQPDGAQRLYDRLAAVDPASAAKLHPNNQRRVIRALEVYAQTGVPMSRQTREWEAEPQEDWLIFALTAPRELLYERINARVDAMVRAGLVEEVRGLLAQGVPPECQAMQAIGYKEIVAALNGDSSLADAIEQIKQNTRRYAKRQLTWLRRDSRVHWLDIAEYDDSPALHNVVIARIRNRMEEGGANDGD